MIAGAGTQLIRQPAKDIYEFVLDLERYKLADLKIGSIHSVAWNGTAPRYSRCCRRRSLARSACRRSNSTSE